MNDINKLIESLQKGGKPAQVGETRVFGGKEYKKMGSGDWVPVVHPEQKQLEAMESKKEMTPKQSLEAKLSEKTSMTQAEKHLHDLKNSAIVEGKKTRSEKPMFTSVDSALAHGYDAQDFREVGNFYYDRAQSLANQIERMKDTKQKVEPALEKIKEHNLRLGKQFISQANRIDDRQAKTKQAVAKSTVMMGHADAAEIETSNYSMDEKASKDLLESFHNFMDGYQYGDVPREIPLDTGILYLVKVEEGLYSGVFKSNTIVDNGSLEDNAKVRIERMTLPSLIQFCKAKEWIKPMKDVTPLDIPEKIEQLNQALIAPVAPIIEPVESDMDKRIRMLELINKLIG